MYEKEDRTSFLVQKTCMILRRVLIFFNGNLLNESLFARWSHNLPKYRLYRASRVIETLATTTTRHLGSIKGGNAYIVTSPWAQKIEPSTRRRRDQKRPADMIPGIGQKYKRVCMYVRLSSFVCMYMICTYMAKMCMKLSSVEDHPTKLKLF